ncbi:hypothetical protein QA584_17440 [Anaerocolumna sp. AGMB13025]|uniref:hypothetical protein n=1 Tax=Anaerocolumna sp. AGMB13025 TaxID=3039116 RepID=UPI00241E8E64|nr:hypothetical protein [Anaerocolumna sp. AGMB13025]WFR55385.1 hypothetical protein QA584_17440 [Anaerocolumna sp. AGMB13025]
MVLVRNTSTSINSKPIGKDLHIILAYKNEVESDTVNQDIIEFLQKIHDTTKVQLEYCYSVKPIMDKRPAIHILLRPSQKLDGQELITYWKKGIAKAAEVTAADKRAMEYYLSKWGGHKINEDSY